MSRRTLTLEVNGRAETVDIDTRALLSDLLRDSLALTGTKRGCETGVCGACTVLVDGQAMKSCLMLAVLCNGRKITTVEGLAAGAADAAGGIAMDETLHPLQENFMRCGGLQCGYCTPGFLMSACALLAENPQPTEAEVRRGLNGNLCRCTGYNGIVQAVLQTAAGAR